MKQKIRVWLDSGRAYDYDGSIIEVIEKFQELAINYPNAHIEFNSDEDGCNIEIYEERLETDKEYEDRLKREVYWKEQREKMDRENYERLKAKFG